MYVPYLYCVVAVWAFMFNPQWIDNLPLGELWIKQLFVFCCIAAVWAGLALSAVADER